MLGFDPPRTPWDLNFAVFGIPVRVHPWFWLVAVLLGLGFPPKILVLWVLVVFVSVLIHELGHAVVVRAYGSDPSITLYGLGGFTSYNTRRRGLEQIVISAAGPAAGFAFAGILYLVFKLARFDVMVSVELPEVLNIEVARIVGSAALTIFINLLFFANIAWGVLNLLPIYPLDGGHIAQEVLARLNPVEGMRWALMLSLSVAIFLAATAFIRWHDTFIALFFAYLAYVNYTALASYSGRGRW